MYRYLYIDQYMNNYLLRLCKYKPNNETAATATTIIKFLDRTLSFSAINLCFLVS